MTEPSVASQILGFTVFLTLAALAALTTHRLASALHGVRRWLNREPINLDAADGVGREHCSVALCTSDVNVRVHASGEWWTFCVEHGLPYLTEGLKGRAA